MTNDRIKTMWKHRRRMAYGAYIAGLVLFPVAAIKYNNLMQLATAYYSLITFILTAYYTFATYHDVKSNQINEDAN